MPTPPISAFHIVVCACRPCVACCGRGGPQSAVQPACASDLDCPAGQQCLPQLVCAVCYPGLYECQGDVSMVCDPLGSQWLVDEDCTTVNQACNENLGVCESPCGALGKMAGTNAGCEFWAVDLHNGIESQECVYLDAQNAPFAVIVSNTSKTVTAEVILTLPNGQAYPANVLPQTLATFPIPATWSQDGTARSNSAFHIISTAPIVAYQFNPLDNVDVFSNDASLLLPVDAMGSDYLVMTREHEPGPSFGQYPSFFTLVGVTEQAVEVTMQVTGGTAAGGEFPALSAGQSHTFSLAKGDVVNIESTSGGDLTGSRVTGTGPFALFSGHVASRTHPEPSGCCADHLEQQLPPIDRWGTDFAIGRSVKRRFEPDHFRVLASES
ncbi:MAG: IgGFc-binding protein, partial [Myxococcota bacterium]|nr:IgGFc-binding protein [Myxococcota bacterium]